MKRKSGFLFILPFFLFLFGAGPLQEENSKYLCFVTDASVVRLYWKDDKGRIIRSLQNLKSYVESKHRKLRFAMNGGMYMENNAPLGLYIENGKTLRSLNTRSGSGNFHLKPNGVFYITGDNRAIICKTEEFRDNGKVNFATQSGPMLLIDGEVHPAFTKGSSNLNIRNGVGILPNNKVIFVMSKEFVNFYDFAEFFKKLNCKNALYLDGFVSRAYLPEENWNQLDGDFGVMIGVAE